MQLRKAVSSTKGCAKTRFVSTTLMMMTLLLLGLTFALGFVGLGCKRPSSTEMETGPAASSSSLPADRLAQDEVPEGKERAFGLPLPRATRIGARFPDAVHLSTSHTPEELANFVRSRVREGKTMTGTSVTRFDDVVPLADPAKRLQIEIRRAPMTSDLRSEMIVRNISKPPPEEPNLTPEERMRRAGFTVDGKPLDRKHMQ